MKAKRQKSLMLFLLLLLLFLCVPLIFGETYSLESPRTLENSDDQGYNYMNKNRFFSVYFGDDPSSGEVVKFTKDNVHMSIFPMALNWNNDLSQLEQISMPQSVSPQISGSEILFPNAYGTNINLKYEVQLNQVKEKLIISSLSALPTPAQYVIDGGNVQLELGFQLSSNGRIFLDGVEWDKSSQVSTTNDVLVKNAGGEILYTLPRPFAIDNNNDIVYGHYLFKKSANKLYVRIYIPYSWLQTANYPIMIDPTFTVDYSPIPATHLIDGKTNTEPDFDFISLLDITSAMSDSSDATYEHTDESGLLEHQFLAGAYKFEETTGDSVEDLSGYEFLNLSGSPNLNIGGISGSGIQFDGVNDYGVRNILQNTSSFLDAVVCLSLNDNGISSSENLFDNKGAGNAQGIEMILTSSDTIDFFIRRGATQTTLNAVTPLDDTLWHTICGVSLANGTVEIYIDGILEDSSIGVTGAMVSTIPWYIGQDQTGGSRYSQKMDELCAWTGVGLDYSLIISQYNLTYCGDPDGVAITGRWIETYDSGQDWFLRVKKVSTGTDNIIVYGYNDSDTIQPAQTTTKQLTGTGWFNVNVSSILNYELNTAGLNYSQLRFFTEFPSNFSEVLLRSEVNDTTPPQINSCWTTTPLVGCDGTATWVCNITDESDVDHVNFTIDNTNFTAIMNDTEWYYSMSFSDSINVNETVTLTDVYAYDIFAQVQHNSTNVEVNHVCDFNAILSAGHFHKESFNITETFYIPKLVEAFNTTLSTDIVALTAFNVKRLTGTGITEVWARAFIDDVLLTEEKVRTVSSADEGATGLNPLKFTVSSGSHNFTVEFKLVGSNGTIEVNDIDVVSLRFLSAGVPIRNELINLSFSHSDTFYTDAYNFTIPNTFNSRTYMLIRQNVESTGTTVGEYTVRNRDTDVKSPYALRYIPSVNATGSMIYAYYDDNLYYQPDYSLYSKSTTGQTIISTGKLFNMDLKDNNQESIPAWQTSNNQTNLSSTQTYGVGNHLLMESTQPLYNGDSMFMTMSISFSSTTGAQTPTFIVNSSTPGVDCYSKKERSLSSSSDIGNVFIYTLCNNMTAGNNYTYQMWLEVETGETIEVYDEVMIGIESAEFVIVTTCIEQWQQNPTSCLINDTGLISYTDLNSCGSTFTLPPINGTYQPCNYCSEDLVQTLGTCQSNETQTVDWSDNNYFSCCSVTGIDSDCSVDVLYPFNETTSQSCVFFEQELGVPECPEQFNFRLREKEYCKVNIPLNYSNETFKCIDYIITGIPPAIMQVNPQYRQSGLLGELLYGEGETREYFAPANSLVNFYITGKNLAPETDYILSIECCSDQRCLESSHEFNTGYESLDWIAYRLKWFKENSALALLLFLVILTLFFIFILFFTKK